MAKIWNADADVNIRIFNEQHQTIIDSFYELQEAIVNNRPEAALDRILNTLVSHADYHFKAEEEYFEKYEYPDTEYHEQEHREIKKIILQLRQDLEKQELKSALITLKFLDGYIENHIISTDKKYTKFFNDLGIY